MPAKKSPAKKSPAKKSPAKKSPAKKSGRKSPVKFTTKDGTQISFAAKKPTKVKSAAELEKRIAGLHPKLQANARLCYKEGKFACAKKSPKKKSPRSAKKRSRLIEEM